MGLGEVSSIAQGVDQPDHISLSYQRPKDFMIKSAFPQKPSETQSEATLATYAHLQVDPLLNICVFGESVAPWRVSACKKNQNHMFKHQNFVLMGGAWKTFTLVNVLGSCCIPMRNYSRLFKSLMRLWESHRSMMQWQLSCFAFSTKAGKDIHLIWRTLFFAMHLELIIDIAILPILMTFWCNVPCYYLSNIVSWPSFFEPDFQVAFFRTPASMWFLDDIWIAMSWCWWPKNHEHLTFWLTRNHLNKMQEKISMFDIYQHHWPFGTGDLE